MYTIELTRGIGNTTLQEQFCELAEARAHAWDVTSDDDTIDGWTIWEPSGRWVARWYRPEGFDRLRPEVPPSVAPMPNRNAAHQALVQRVRKAVGALPGVMVMSNPQGLAKVGGRTIRYGLGVGSADLIACVSGRFVALEVKTGDAKLTEDQEVWGEALRMVGGIYREVRSVEDALAAVREAQP